MQEKVEDEKSSGSKESCSSDALVHESDEPELPKVTGLKDRHGAPPGFGVVELSDARGSDDCDAVVRALYEHVDRGAARSQQIISRNKYVAFVPEDDIDELMQVSKSPEMTELRRQVEKQTKR